MAEQPPKLQLIILVKPAGKVEAQIEMTAEAFIALYQEAQTKGDKNLIVEAIIVNPNCLKEYIIVTMADIQSVIVTQVQTGKLIDIVKPTLAIPRDVTDNPARKLPDR